MSKKVLQARQQKYIKELNKLKTISDLNKKIEFANRLAYDFTNNPAGIYCSNDLEQVYLELANSKTLNLKDTHSKNSFLHVLTTAYSIGGHTRVVEKWIAQADKSQTHSVVLLNQYKTEIPQTLQNNTKDKNGKLFIFDETDLLKNALKLRQLAMNFEYIILHTHMYDPTAIVAFGNAEFTRPIIFYNHADHLFWLGKSIIDKLADLRPNYPITIFNRNIKNPFFLGVPMDIKNATIKDKNQVRKDMKLPLDKKIILCIGEASKFNPVGKNFFGNVLLDILNSNNNIEIIVIGPEQHKKLWKQISSKSKGKIKVIGTVEYGETYFNYLNAADIVIDSWPMSGGTVMIDALACNKPVLSLKSPMGQFNYLETSQSRCETKEELIKKCNRILNDKNYMSELFNEVKTNFDNECSIKNWSAKIDELIKQTPNKHTIKNMLEEYENIEINEHTEILEYLYKKRYKFRGLKYIFEIEKYNVYNARTKAIKLFWTTIFKKTERC